MTMDFDAAWDAWEAAGHGACGGWKYDPGPAVIGCACGTAILVSAEAMPDIAPGYEWHRELADD